MQSQQYLRDLGDMFTRRDDDCRTVLVQVEEEQNNHCIDERTEEQHPTITGKDEKPAEGIASRGNENDVDGFLPA